MQGKEAITLMDKLDKALSNLVAGHIHLNSYLG